MDIINAGHKAKEPALKSLAAMSMVLVVLLLTIELSVTSDRLLSKHSFDSSLQLLDADQSENVIHLDINADVVPSPFVQVDAEILGWIDNRLTHAVNSVHLASTRIRGPPQA